VHGNDHFLIPHCLFEIYPASTTNRSWESCMVRTVSQWAFNRLLSEMESQDEQAAYNLYRRIQGITDAAEFRGRLWERLVHRYSWPGLTATLIDAVVG
jgi:hypothetical protein